MQLSVALHGSEEAPALLSKDDEGILRNGPQGMFRLALYADGEMENEGRIALQR